MNRCSYRILAAAALAACISLPAFSQTINQEVSLAALPNAPDFLPATESSSSSPARSTDAEPAGQNPSAPPGTYDDGSQTKRILGIIPNFRSVSANQHLPPQSLKEKFVTASQDSFDYSSVVVPALLAGFDQARNATPEFRQGAIGYGRYFWHSFVDQTDENLWVEFIVPAIAHEDTRYYTLGSGGFKKRAYYAIKHVVVTRDDAGKDVFNSGEVVGSAISAGLSNLYYPAPERTVGNTLGQWGEDIGIDTFVFAFREFWPDINHKLFHGAKPSTN